MRFDMISIPTSIRKGRTADVHRKVSDIMRAVKNTANGEALQMLKMFHKTTATWNHQPDFHFKIIENPNSIEVTVWTNDNIYRWINNGTDVRYMHMTEDFRPKTIPGVIGSTRGHPGPSHIGMPLDGIQARGFSEIIFAVRGPVAVKHISDRFNREVANTFTRIF